MTGQQSSQWMGLVMLSNLRHIESGEEFVPFVASFFGHHRRICGGTNWVLSTTSNEERKRRAGRRPEDDVVQPRATLRAGGDCGEIVGERECLQSLTTFML